MHVASNTGSESLFPADHADFRRIFLSVGVPTHRNQLRNKHYKKNVPIKSVRFL